MPTFAELADTDPTSWLHQARGWDELADDLTARAGRARSGTAHLDERWAGADAHTARARRDELLARLTAAADRARRVSDVLGRHAGIVMAAQQRMFAAVQGANPLTTQVTEDGLVVPAPGLLTSPLLAELLPVHLADARRISSEIATALEDATRSDAETVAQLQALAPGGTGGPTGSVPTFPPDGSDPETVHAWWAGLAPAERDRLVAQHPDRVGGLHGIPAADRDRANRIRLDSVQVHPADRRTPASSIIWLGGDVRYGLPLAAGAEPAGRRGVPVPVRFPGDQPTTARRRARLTVVQDGPPGADDGLPDTGPDELAPPIAHAQYRDSGVSTPGTADRIVVRESDGAITERPSNTTGSGVAVRATPPFEPL